MAYDEDLADRIGELVAAERAVDQKKMFGGLAFLLEGNLVIAASGQGGILVRVGPAECDKLIKAPGASVAIMRGRACPVGCASRRNISLRNVNSRSG